MGRTAGARIEDTFFFHINIYRSVGTQARFELPKGRISAVQCNAVGVYNQYQYLIGQETCILKGFWDSFNKSLTPNDSSKT